METRMRDANAFLYMLRRTERLLCAREEQQLPPAAQWLRDNARALYGLAAGLRQRQGYLNRREFCRLRGLCGALWAQQAGPWQEGRLCRAVNALQGEEPLTVRELRALPDLLAWTGMERLCALLPGTAAEYRAWQAGARLQAAAAAGKLPPISREPVTLWRALELLAQAGQTEAARALEAAMRAAGIPPRAAARQARESLQRHAAEVGDLVSALLSLPRLHGGRITEGCSVACARLRQHPGFFRMDAESRALYLTAVSRLSRRLGVPEERVCAEALALCREKTGAEADPGYYLLEDAAPLYRALGRRRGPLSQAARIRLYAGLLALGAGLSAAGGALLLPWYGALPLAFVGMDWVHRLLGRAAARLLPPRTLPRLRPGCLPEGTRALVAVPTVLLHRKHALKMCRALSVLYLANAKAPADFLLLSDFAEAPGETVPEDAEIMAAAESGIRALRQTYGPRFFYLQRGRSLDARNGCWYGLERKRGALALLGRLLAGEDAAEPLLACTETPGFFARRYTQVITLDADTFLPDGAAEKLLGALLHPLQRGRVSVIQPRMLTLPMHVQTHAQYLLGGQSGADGYGAAAADLYQDAFGRGSFMGKGIYDPAAFRAATAELPQGQILSHDLIEGELAGAALAGDIVCCDGHPRQVEGFLKRAHRWIRGDWQLLPFLADRRLDLLSRLKLWDNLRRSLTPFFRLVALAVSALQGAYLPFLLALLPLFSPQALGTLLILPASALTGVDAAFRAVWRLYVSRRRLLEWTTADQAEESDLASLRRAVMPMLWGAALLFAAVPRVFGPGFALGVCWLAYPLVVRWMNRPRAHREALSAGEEGFLRGVARDTLAFFEAHVTAETHFLPPDNVQLSPARGAALRTSPTNIGLYLLGLCAAREMGLMEGKAMLRRIADAVATLEKLPRWHGIPYNWYDLHTLAPLPPGVVSSVDAGNCLICLIAAAQAVRQQLQAGEYAEFESLPARLDALGSAMQLRRLYDRRAQLFHVDYTPGVGLSRGHYDLLASEAQLLSFAAILTGAVPERHWWRLGRPWVQGPGRVLLSWSGTMFEYMMGGLLLPAGEDTLLHAAQAGCVRAQRRAGRLGFFGVSESGYAQFDAALNYRYQAFGVRELALDTHCTGDVYAPYAAALALRIAPRAACGALMRMRDAGAYGEYGFFEAIDLTAPGPRVVRSHMAHHQGMLLCALCNALCGDYLPRLLLQLPRVQARLPLLQELPPRRLPRLPRPLRAHRDAAEEPPCRLRADSALPADAWMLSGGGTSLLMDARGHSRLHSGDISLTRFDPWAGAASGPQLYLAAGDGAPLRLTGGAYTWLDGAARCCAAADGLRAEVTVCVDPLTGAAVYRASLRNTDSAPRRLTLAFYLEPALAEQRADSAHTAFSTLFLTAERQGANGCVIRRAPREGGAARCLQVRAWGQDMPLACDMTRDRAVFFGREGTVGHPLGLTAEWPEAGAVTDCLALRVHLDAAPGQEAVFCFAAGPRVPEGLEDALRAEGLACTRARVCREMLDMDTARMALCSRLAARLLFAQDASVPGRKGDLWALGISGDVPLMVLEAREEEQAGEIGLAARLLAFLCECGEEAELAVLLPGEGGYEQPLRAYCEGLLLQPRLQALRGRLHLLTEVSPAGRGALAAFCRLWAQGGRPLGEQLNKAEESPRLFAAPAGGQLPVLPRLAAFNGYGGFLPEGGYAVCGTAPAPWCHWLSSEGFGTLVCEQGILYSHAGNSRLARVTRAGQDGVLLEPAEEYFVTENGKSWSLTRRPLQNAACRALYAPGTAVYQCALPGLSAELTCFADGELPCGGRVLTLRNTGAAPRRLTVTGAARFALGETGEGTCAAAGEHMVCARGDLPGIAFYFLEGSAAHTLSAARYGIGDAPRCPGGQEPGSVGVLQREIALGPGQAVCLRFWLGHCAGEQALADCLARLTPGRERLARARWRQRLDGLQCYLPDGLLAGYVNGFLPYQVRAARLQARAGFYQAGGAWGFRDQLQDMLSLVYTEPERVRGHLLLCASRQYLQGDVQHWWHPGGPGVRTRISDDRLFLPWVTARYIRVTGDREVLEQRVPWLDSPALAEHERDRYETARETSERDTLAEHCLRAIRRMTYGPHGIPRMEGGDWNDGMNAVEGESAWLGFFLIVVLRDFSPLCAKEAQEELDGLRRRLQSAMQAAWTGQWFLRAWYADGRTLGAPDSEVPRIDLISQCFACFAGMPREQVRTALEAAWHTLHRPDAGITLLLTPPFTPEEGAGYIGAYAPGVRENGGQYTHAVPWFMRALLMAGQTDRAWQLLRECLPYSHSDTPEKARQYRAEPYALAADIYVDGRGGWTWYTGSAGWLYEVFLHDFLGFDKQGDSVRLAPRLPADWEECTVVYRFGGSRWQLTAGRDIHYTTADGERMAGAYVPLRDDGRTHEIRFPAGW